MAAATKLMTLAQHIMQTKVLKTDDRGKDQFCSASSRQCKSEERATSNERLKGSDGMKIFMKKK
jgi:predicted transglutaminase-like cysteine proteinase